MKTVKQIITILIISLIAAIMPATSAGHPFLKKMPRRSATPRPRPTHKPRVIINTSRAIVQNSYAHTSIYGSNANSKQTNKTVRKNVTNLGKNTSKVAKRKGGKSNGNGHTNTVNTNVSPSKKWHTEKGIRSIFVNHRNVNHRKKDTIPNLFAPKINSIDSLSPMRKVQ